VVLHTLEWALQSGTLGPFVFPDIAPKGWRLTFTNGEDWPQEGPVCTVLIERNGELDYSITLDGDVWENHMAEAIVTGGWEDPRTVSLTVTMHTPCVFGLVWEAL
jgi:hypothetical protein